MKIRTKVLLVLLVPLLLFIGIGIFNVLEMNKLTSFTSKMYKHPYAVSNAVRDVNIGILDIHRNMKDIALANNIEQINIAISNVDKSEKEVFKSFELINERFLGDKKLVLESVHLFTNWKKIRDKVINYAKNGEKESAAEITKTTGALHIKKLDMKVKALLNFANAKGISFNEKAQEYKKRSFKIILIAFGVGIFLSLVFGFIITNTIINQLKVLTKKLTDSASVLNNSAVTMDRSSGELSESTTQQAAMLQESVSSLHEISSIISNNADSATRSTEVSKASQVAATSGKETINEMISAISDISSSNANISKQMHKSNDEIAAIAEVILGIGEKTKVINDIVFQTKLLSFNASVEAARAGEHGKGFSVVAEEVGNLAAMSGNAAKEISDMIADSSQKINEIVDRTKTQVESLIVNGKEKVQRGMDVANDCGQALDEILLNVESVNEMVLQISDASSEQSTGVGEVSKAMSELDQVTHQNTNIANESSKLSANLNEQADDLNHVINDLIKIVGGGDLNNKLETQEIPDSNILELKRKVVINNKSTLAVSEDLEKIPSPDDNRFEDL